MLALDRRRLPTTPQQQKCAPLYPTFRAIGALPAPLHHPPHTRDAPLCQPAISRIKYPRDRIAVCSRVYSSPVFIYRPANKTMRVKKTLAAKMKSNRPIPQWIRMRTGNTIRYNAKRRHWRRTKIGL